MTTLSSDTKEVQEVFGVLLDPSFLCHQTVSSSETVDAAVGKLWKSVNERVDKNSTSEIPPSIVQVVLGEIGPSTPFKVLTSFHGYQTQI